MSSRVMDGAEAAEAAAAAAAARAVTVVDVTWFGADPDGDADSAPAVRAALAHAQTIAGPVVVDFPTGEYQLWPEHAVTRELYVSNTVGDDERHRIKTIGILVEGCSDLTIEGNGSRFVYHGLQTTFAVIDSARVRFRGVTIDVAAATVVDATVVEAGFVEDGLVEGCAAEGHAADVPAAEGCAADGPAAQGGAAYRVIQVPETNPYRVDGRTVHWLGETSPVTGEPYWSATDALEYTQIHDPATARTVRGDNPLFVGVDRATDLGAGRIRLDYAPVDRESAHGAPAHGAPAHGAPTHGAPAHGAPTDIGLVYQMRLTTRDHPGMLILESTDVTLEDLRVDYLHGFGVVAQLSRDVTVERVVFQAPERSGRSTAGFADFLQFSGVAGDVIVRDCVFDGPHDDPINVHGTYLRVVERRDDRSLVLEYAHPESAGFPACFVGDEIEIVDVAKLVAVGGGGAGGAESGSGAGSGFGAGSGSGFALVVASVDGPSGRDHARNLRRMTVEFTTELPAEVTTEAVRAGAFVVENVTYTPRVTVTGCTFRNTPTRAILVTTRRPVRIERNRFERLSMASISISADAHQWFESGPVTDVVIRDNVFVGGASPIISIEPTNVCVDASVPVHRGIVIEDNEFVVDAVTLVDAKSVCGLRFAGNRVTRVGAGVGAAGAGDAPPTFRFLASTDITIEGNDFGAGVVPVVEDVVVPVGPVDAGSAGGSAGAVSGANGSGRVRRLAAW